MSGPSPEGERSNGQIQKTPQRRHIRHSRPLAAARSSGTRSSARRPSGCRRGCAHASWGIRCRRRAALGLLAFDRLVAVGDPVPLTLPGDGGWVDVEGEGDFGRLLPVGDANLDHLPLLEGEPMAWLRYHILCPFVSLVGNGDIFASNRLGLNSGGRMSNGDGFRKWRSFTYMLFP